MQEKFDYSLTVRRDRRHGDFLFLKRYIRCLLETRNQRVKAVVETDNYERFLPSTQHINTR